VVSSSLGLYLSAWIRTSKDSSDYSNTDSSLSDLVERVLPLGTYYTAIFAFIGHRSHHDYGLVNHALCAAMREMLKVRVCSISHYFGLPNLIYACRTTKLSYPILNMHTTPHPPSPCKNSGSMSIQLCILFLSSSSSPSPSLPPPLSTPSESLALSPRKFC
jgi:hypothetical protein